MQTSNTPRPLPHTKSIGKRTAQTMFLLKSVPATKQISISVDGAGSHTWSMRIPVEDWQSMVPTIESSIDSAFRNEDFEVTVSFMQTERKKRFAKGSVDLTDVFGAVVPSVEAS